MRRERRHVGRIEARVTAKCRLSHVSAKYTERYILTYELSLALSVARQQCRVGKHAVAFKTNC